MSVAGGKGVVRIASPRHRRGPAGLLLVLLLLSGALAGLSWPADLASEPAEASANPIPIMALSLSPTQLQATITQSQLGAVAFMGRVEVDKLPGIERLMVTLTAVVNTGWPVTISPMNIPFVNPGIEQFQVTVVVPPATSSTIIGTLTVTGSAKAPGLTPIIGQASGVVTVGQYFKLRLETEAPLRECSPAETTYNIVNIFNDGNAQDTIHVEIDNLKELLGDQWTVLLASTDVTIPPDEYTPVKVTIQTSQDWRLWAKEIKNIIVLASSEEAEAKNLFYTKTYPIFVYMKGYHIPGFDPFLSIVALAIAVVAFQGAQRRRDSRLERGRVKMKNQTP